ncbi:hypothetical protein HDU98_010192 [Podochytrium sp. JEL0797]|nr:hypothetical protein HDU98_010192 [Podochytrium sp. JEL0797]
MGLLSMIFTPIAVLLAAFLLCPRTLKRHIALFVVRMTSVMPDKTLLFKHKVLPHDDALTQVAPNLWTLVGSLPARGPRLKRRMVVYRLAGTKTLLIHSPICVNETVLAEIKALGTVEWIVVPNEMHRLDAHAWSVEFPEAKVICPDAALEQVEKAVKVSQTVESAFSQLAVGKPAYEHEPVMFAVPKGFYSASELVFFFKHEGVAKPAYSMVVCDLFFNLDPLDHDADPALISIGSACGFGCTAIGRFLFVENKTMAKEWMEKSLAVMAKELNVVHVSMAHGAELRDENAAIVKELEHCALTFIRSHQWAAEN